MVGEKETVGLHGISRDFYDGGEAVRERTESVGTRGKTYQGISSERGIDGRAEERQSYGVGETDEQHQEQSRGNSAERSSLHRLNENKKVEEMQAEETTVPSVELSFVSIKSKKEQGEILALNKFAVKKLTVETVSFW